MREKLIEILARMLVFGHGTLSTMADYLIANGVRLEQKQATSKTSDRFASDTTLDNQVSSSKWISVEERLPEANTEVLTYRKGDINLEWRWHTYWDNDEFSDCPVTHWMPLPPAPKGE